MDTDNANKEIEDLNDEIRKLREDIEQSYYRIPKQEFETITVKNISQEVLDQLNKRIAVFRNWAGFIFVLISSVGLYQGNEFFSDISKDVKDIENNMTTKIINFEEKFNLRIESKFLKEFRTFDDQIETIIDKKFDVMNEKLAQIKTNMESDSNRTFREIGNLEKSFDSRINVAEQTFIGINEEAQKTSFTNEFEILKQYVESGKRTYAEASKQLETLIHSKSKFIKEEGFFTSPLGSLFRWYVNAGFYEEMDQLRTVFETDYSFTSDSWVNISIADMHLYEESYAEIHKTRALEAIDKSLHVLPDYGVPYSVRLIIHMIDYVRSPDAAQKQIEKDSALKIMNRINAGSRLVTSFETYQYLDRRRDDPSITIFIQNLWTLFPEQTQLLKSRFDEYNENNKKT